MPQVTSSVSCRNLQAPLICFIRVTVHPQSHFPGLITVVTFIEGLTFYSKEFDKNWHSNTGTGTRTVQIIISKWTEV